MNFYVGHPLQTRGAEEYILQNGKGQGMKFLYLRNGIGLELWVALDRCADPYRVTYNGKNMGYMTPAGNVHPSYYDADDAGFLRNFTAGFCTTVGFEGAGGASVDNGEYVPQHGRIGNAPAEGYSLEETEEALIVKATVRDCVLFGRRMVLNRTYTLSYTENKFTMSDTVTNEGEAKAEFLLLYHCNMGYPLLNENSVVKFPHEKIWAHSEEAKRHIDSALTMEKPQQGFIERCYFFDPKEFSDGLVHTGIFSPDANVGVTFSYDKKALPCLTEWKMMGRRDYVLGIEPGNCYPSPRTKMRENGVLPYLEADASYSSEITFSFTDKLSDFEDNYR